MKVQRAEHSDTSRGGGRPQHPHSIICMKVATQQNLQRFKDENTGSGTE